MTQTVQCGFCRHFHRTDTGAGRCAARGGVGGEGAHRWPFLLYGNLPIVCSDFKPKPEVEHEPEAGQQNLALEEPCR